MEEMWAEPALGINTVGKSKERQQKAEKAVQGNIENNKGQRKEREGENRGKRNTRKWETRDTAVKKDVQEIIYHFTGHYGPVKTANKSKHWETINNRHVPK